MLLDKQGRLLGKVNLLDLLALFFLLSLAGTVAYAVGVARYRSLQVVSMGPNPIVAGPGQHLIFKGTGFDPSTTIRFGEYPPRGSVFWDESTLGIEINGETDPGTYQVGVRDGRGRSTVLPDRLKVVWMPQISEVQQRIIYQTGEGSRIDILGKFFARSRSVRVGDRELDTSNSVDPNHVTVFLKPGDAPLPLGEYPVTVTNAGGQSVTWQHGVTVVPAPEVQVRQVRPKIIYQTGEGSHVDILGKFFTRSHSVRVGDRELDTSDSASSEQVSAHLKQGAVPLPLGEHPVTVADAGSEPVTLEHGVTVVPVPEVYSVTPDRIVLGDTVDLFLYGKNLRDGTIVWFREQKHPVGQATLVSPDCLKVRLKTDFHMLARHNDVILELPDGPKITVLPHAVHVNNAYEVFMVAAVLLDDKSTRAIREFKGSLEWKFRRPLGTLQFPGRSRNFNTGLLNPVIEVLLPVRTEIAKGKFETADMRCRPLRKGTGVWFTLNGQELSGKIVSEPFAVFSDDYFADKKPL